MEESRTLLIAAVGAVVEAEGAAAQLAGGGHLERGPVVLRVPEGPLGGGGGPWDRGAFRQAGS